MVRIKAKNLEDFVRDIFAATGCSHAESARIGKYLVGANLAGHDSHGVARVPRYVQWKRDGMLHPDQTVERVIDTPVLAILDGKFGFGQTVAPQAVAIGIEKCMAHGLSAIGLRNSGHVGRVGEWAEMAAAAGLVSVHWVNVVGSVLVAPFGGVDRRFSTAPFCVGIPRGDAEPIVLDFATSLVAEGKVLIASQGGKPISDNALVAPDGTMSGDPHVLYGDYDKNPQRDYKKGRGAIRAFGEHKGSGLALMCEMLGGALTGNGASTFERRWSQGMFSFYINPKTIDPAEFFPTEVARCVSFVKSAKPVELGGEVLVPGEPEIRNRVERRAKGVPLPDDTLAALIAAARQVGLDGKRIQALEII
ncbi:MAG: malate/lactate/ureidoglycolate dehydrogenase [Rhizobiales bacterium]|nr:malate/lactate/ureidoglycolate dehydrogenase [Hyphomicrobiales bacterium]